MNEEQVELATELHEGCRVTHPPDRRHQVVAESPPPRGDFASPTSDFGIRSFERCPQPGLVSHWRSLRELAVGEQPIDTCAIEVMKKESHACVAVNPTIAHMGSLRSSAARSLSRPGYR
jgi:hypothetical protein